MKYLCITYLKYIMYALEYGKKAKEKNQNDNIINT